MPPFEKILGSYLNAQSVVASEQYDYTPVK